CDERKLMKAVKKGTKTTAFKLIKSLEELNIIARKKGYAGVMKKKIWSSNEWDKIIFSDESRFELFQNNSNDWVWRKPGEKYNKENLSPTVKKSDGIIVWGCFTREKMDPLALVEEDNTPCHKATVEN
ncbi:947_t:CDS:2, partial [Entrophospora sp. SA101]